jgi:hypothetical protein
LLEAGSRNGSSLAFFLENPERKLTKKILNKRDQRAKEKKQRQWERNLRFSMSSDF